MAGVLSSAFWSSVLICSVELFFWKSADYSHGSPFSPEANVTMPDQWDKRYYRTSVTHGQELSVVRRGHAPKTWAVLLPDGSLRSLDISHRPTSRVAPNFAGPPLAWTSQPVLDAARQQEISDQADIMVANRSLRPLPLMGAGGEGPGVQIRRFMTVAAGLPAFASRWADGLSGVGRALLV